MGELGEGELLDRGDLYLGDGAEEAREGGAKVAAEALVEVLQRPHLVLADALGPLEVVGADLEVARCARGGGAARGAAAEDLAGGGGAGRRLDGAVVHRGQQGVNFGLVQY